MTNLFSKLSFSFILLAQVLGRDYDLALSTNINPSFIETDIGFTLVNCSIICYDPHQLQEFSSTTACLLLRRLQKQCFWGKCTVFMCANW